ncbi:hypothetical protein [Cellulomonas cellasea]|uniref:Uncharacterized protein n=1 Tax=Cellulomonas cellasea TaxID=43670 RepID=A0A7W4UHY9_9CELL|nr:hypothetical protein [Cellulomonas cellasea]MBB2924493.1 hypothetical protein [Cellulomonas cellasea]
MPQPTSSEPDWLDLIITVGHPNPPGQHPEDPPRRATVTTRTYRGETVTLELDVLARAPGHVQVAQPRDGQEPWKAWISSGDVLQPMLWQVTCPYDDQGLVGAMMTAAGRVVLYCDGDGHVWLEPSQVSYGSAIVPRSSDWRVVEGVTVTPGTVRWATAEDLPAAWRAEPWQVYSREW